MATMVPIRASDWYQSDALIGTMVAMVWERRNPYDALIGTMVTMVWEHRNPYDALIHVMMLSSCSIWSPKFKMVKTVAIDPLDQKLREFSSYGRGRFMWLNENSDNFWSNGSISIVFTILNLGDQMLQDESIVTPMRAS